MNLKITIETNLKDACVDFIELKISQKTLTLDWKVSETVQTETGFTCYAAQVEINEGSGAGRIQELQGAKISAIQIYSEDPQPLTQCILREFCIDDFDSSIEHLTFKPIDLLPLSLRES